MNVSMIEWQSDARLPEIHTLRRILWLMHRKGALVTGYTICVGGLLLTVGTDVAVALGITLVVLAVGATLVGAGADDSQR